MISTTMELSQSRVNYHSKIVEHTGGVLFEDDSFIVEAALLEHRIDSYGYRITEKDRQEAWIQPNWRNMV